MGSSAKKTILLVDDDRDTCLTFKKMLEDQDFDVRAFVKPQDVMEKFRPGVYDLVVLDIKMPIINGLQLYQEIRKVDKNVKVCFITASEQYYTGLIRQLEREKCFMQKPISQDDFIDRIKLALAESILKVLVHRQGIRYFLTLLTITCYLCLRYTPGVAEARQDISNKRFTFTFVYNPMK